MAFAIVISPTARRQIERAVVWWTEHRPSAPTLLVDELDRALHRLAANPNIGTRSTWARLPEVRRVLLRRADYVVVYRVRPRASRVEVLAFWHARRGGLPR